MPSSEVVCCCLKAKNEIVYMPLVFCPAESAVQIQQQSSNQPKAQVVRVSGASNVVSHLFASVDDYQQVLVQTLSLIGRSLPFR